MMSTAEFKIPVALVLFKRVEKSLLVLRQIGKVRPPRLYLLADGGRNAAEHQLAIKCRERVEAAIDWDCEVVKIYHEQNVGVFRNIAGGALKVFEREDVAIFLEDDNFPAVSFFYFCAELLEKYSKSPNILWVCGTNYLRDISMQVKDSYIFTRNLHPCGWASWREKFTSNYLIDFEGLDSKEYLKNARQSYLSPRLFRQDRYNWLEERRRILKYGNSASWDHQMSYSLRTKNLLGIIPVVNLIENIGVDAESIHGGTSTSLPMTSRFCEIPITELSFPLQHPSEISINRHIEYQIERIITYPVSLSMKMWVASCVKKWLGIDPDESLKTLFSKRFKRRN